MDVEDEAEIVEELSDDLIPLAPSPTKLRPASERPVRSTQDVNSTLMGIPAEASRSNSQPYSHITVEPKAKAVDLADRKEAAKELLSWCERQLVKEKDPIRKARLHFEQARLFETTLGELKQALKHYQLAHALHAAYPPVLAGMIRVRIRAEQWDGILGPLLQYIALCDRPEEKAALHALRASVLETHLGKPKEARSEYEKALALSPLDGALLYQVYRSARRDQDWAVVQDTLGRWAQLASTEPDWAAALCAEQARVTEHLRRKPQDALSLYRRAFELSPRATSAAFALQHLYAEKGMQADLVQLFVARAGLMSDAQARATELVCAGALCAHSGGDLKRAAQFFESAFSACSDDRSILQRLRRVYSDLDHHEGVLSTLLRLESGARDDLEVAELNVAMGQLLFAQLNRPKEAVARFEKANSLAPPTEQSVTALCTAYEAQGDYERVVSVLSQAERGSDSIEYRVETHLRLAKLLEYRLSNPEGAVRHYQAALGLDPHEQESYRQLVRLLGERQRYEEVIELHERAAEHAENDEIYFAQLFMIGELLEHRLAAPQRAIAVYQRVLERKADHLGAFFRLQRTAQNAEKFDVLVEAYLGEAKVQTSKKQKLSLLHAAARVCEEHLADHERALSLYQQVLSLEALRKETLFSLARFFDKHGRREEQLGTLEQLLKVIPEATRRAEELSRMGAIAEYHLGDAEAGLDYYKRAFELVPSNEQAASAVERVLHKTGRYDELAAHYEERLKSVSEPRARALGYVHLGELYEWRLSKLPQALSAYAIALKDVPDLTTAHAGLLRVLEQRPEHEKTQDALEHSARYSRDPTLSTWARLRAAELAESLSTKGSEAAKTRYEAVLASVPKQSQGVLFQLRGNAADVGAAAIKTTLSAIPDKSTQHALLRELLRLAQATEVEDKPTALVHDILTIDERDRFALFAAELDALALGDEQALAQADRWTVAAVSEYDSATSKLSASAYRTRLAEYLESKNTVVALQLLSEALANDGVNIGAARALTRIAETVDDPELLSESAQREASVVGDTARASRLLVRAAEIARSKNQESQAADYLRTALTIHPASVRAAKAIYDLLGGQGKYVELSAILREAAESCRSPKVAVEHWISVARIAADKRDDLAEAISVLGRLEKTKSGNLHSSLALGDLLIRDRQWEKAVVQLQKSMSLGPDQPTLIALKLQLAEVYQNHLGRFADASRELKDILRVDPQHQGALRRLLAIQMKEGSGVALETAQKLVAVSTDKQRAEALLSLGRLQVQVRKAPEAIGSFCEAVEIVGLQPPDASEELRKILGSPSGAKIGWGGYERALRSFADRTQPSEHQARVYRELGRVIAQRDVVQAIETLHQGLDINPKDFSLRRLYSELLKEQRRFEEARSELVMLVQQEPEKKECWEDLVVVQEALLATQEADVARGALSILGGENEHQRQTWAARSPRFGQVPAGGLHGQALNDSLPDPISLDALSLLDALGNLIGKVFPPNLVELGVNQRNKVGPRGAHPLRPIVDRACQCLGGFEVDLYVSEKAPAASLVLTDPLGLVLPASMQNLSEAEQLFVVTRLLVNSARRAEAVDALSLAELRLLFGASSRIVDPAVAVLEVDGSELAEVTRRLTKALPWLSKGRIEDAARRYAASAETDVAAFRRSLVESSYRVALVFSDDLGMVEKLLAGRGEVLGLTEHQAIHLAKQLLSFWSSPRAFEMRRGIGLMQ